MLHFYLGTIIKWKHAHISSLMSIYHQNILILQGLELMHRWGFALREGVFAETKEGICRNKDLKRLALKFKKSAR